MHNTEITNIINSVQPEKMRARILELTRDLFSELEMSNAANQDNVISIYKKLLKIGKHNQAVDNILKIVSAYLKERNLRIDTSTLSEETITNQTVIKPLPISGFPEFTPGMQKALENCKNRLSKVFELHGFVLIDTPIVERLEILASKGEDVDKEIYGLTRLQELDENDQDAKLALRYDLTVPFSRYVAQHFNSLTFPFKRSHIGSCFRGERPQEGRYRQFTQADIDVVNIDRLPISFDVDIPLIVSKALLELRVDEFTFRISNRKILTGYLDSLGVINKQLVTRILDKLDKIGFEQVVERLVSDAKVSTQTAHKILEIAEIRGNLQEFQSSISQLKVKESLFNEGVAELTYVLEQLTYSENSGSFIADLSITRGFDYYTGTVYEVQWDKYPELGSIAAGGRYEDLASKFIKKKLPGVGMSIGISRIFGKQVLDGVFEPMDSSADVLVVNDGDTSELVLRAFSDELRSKGIRTELFFESASIKKQINYADKKDIQFLVFPSINELKNLKTGEQIGYEQSELSILIDNLKERHKFPIQ